MMHHALAMLALDDLRYHLHGQTHGPLLKRALTASDDRFWSHCAISTKGENTSFSGGRSDRSGHNAVRKGRCYRTSQSGELTYVLVLDVVDEGKQAYVCSLEDSGTSDSENTGLQIFYAKRAEKILMETRSLQPAPFLHYCKSVEKKPEECKHELRAEDDARPNSFLHLPWYPFQL